MRQAVVRVVFVATAATLAAIGVTALFPGVGQIAVACAFIVAIGYAALVRIN